MATVWEKGVERKRERAFLLRKEGKIKKRL